MSTPERSPGDVVLRVRDLSVTYGNDRVLDRVSIDVHRDERLGIVGRSGAGKSSFARALLAAVDAPGRVTGEITYHPRTGDPVDVLDLGGSALRRFRWETVSLVEDVPGALDPAVTIRTHFEETLRAHDADVPAGLERARRSLSALDLDPDRVLDARPDEMSGGVKRHALVALGLVLDPEVLVLDDLPAVFDRLARNPTILRRRDLAVVLLGSELPAITTLATRLAILYGGDFVEVGPPRELLDEPSHPYTRSIVDYFRGPG